MPVDIIEALTKLAHELVPWAAVVTAAVSAWQLYRSKEHIKLSVAKTAEVSAKLDDNTAKTEEVAAQVAAVQETVNGRMDQLLTTTAQAAKAEVRQGVGQ